MTSDLNPYLEPTPAVEDYREVGDHDAWAGMRRPHV